MAKHIQNLTFHIQNDFLSLSPIGRFLHSLFSIGPHLHFSLQIQIEENTPISHITIYIMKVFRWSSMRIHEVVGKSAIFYLHHEGA
jgi:hypothetical protein